MPTLDTQDTNAPRKRHWSRLATLFACILIAFLIWLLVTVEEGEEPPAETATASDTITATATATEP